MSFKFVNVEQLTVFLTSLQNLLLSKHEAVKEALPAEFFISFDDKLSEELSERKLEQNPTFRRGEFGLQLKFYKDVNGAAGVEGYCKNNFDEPDNSDKYIWGKIKVHLVTFKRPDTELNKGLKSRKICMGLAN